MKRAAKITLAFLNLAGYLGTVIVNALATLLPINGKATGELSDQYPNLFVPSGLTFSIWGVIYLLLAIFVVYQIIIAFRKKSNGRGIFEKIGALFFISSILNIGWIFAWHMKIVWLSLIIMVLLFVTLLIIYLRLGIGRSETRNIEKGLVYIPFSVYIGWITIATIANVTALLVDIGWKGFGIGDQFWAVIVIGVGIIITLAMIFIRKDIFYSLVVDWSLLGILLKRLSDTNTDALFVIIICSLGLAVITIGIIVQLIVRKKIY